MQIHNLKPKNKLRKARRIGRGGKRGTFSGRGIKGMGARAGAKYRPAERDIVKRIPKLRGYKFNSFRSRPFVLNLSDLEKRFKANDVISPDTLLKSGLLSKKKGRLPAVKILGLGGFSKKFVFKGVLLSASVASKAKGDVAKDSK